MQEIRVMIVGAGSGGLCLAQGLKSDNIAFDVFERDYSPTDRLQGYRLSLNPGGASALRSCLPAALFQKLVASSPRPSRAVTFLDHRLNHLLEIELPAYKQKGIDSELPVSRIALRRILLEGLDPFIHFGKKFVAFEDALEGRVTARFQDGSSATGDVLIGADGAGSHLRSQLLPHAQRVETGILAISGKIGLTQATRAATPEAFFRGPTLVLGPRGCFLFGNAVEYESTAHQERTRPEGDKAPLDDRDDGVYDREEYVMWGFSARREKFDIPENITALADDVLKDAVENLMEGWHPVLPRLIQMSEASTLSPFRVKSSVPIPPWKTRNVTLLGDALHNMTPYRGIGANTALRDAAALRRTLASVGRGEIELIPALAAYEREMIDYGFRAVRRSLREMQRVHSEGFLARVATKVLLRTVDLVPPLKSVFHGE